MEFGVVPQNLIMSKGLAGASHSWTFIEIIAAGTKHDVDAGGSGAAAIPRQQGYTVWPMSPIEGLC